jgi:hypothetical protein
MPKTFEPNTFTMFNLTSWICLMNQYGYKLSSDKNSNLNLIAERELKKFYDTEQARKFKSLPHLDMIEFIHRNSKN